MSFHSSEYMAGALFPNTLFPGTNMTGREHWYSVQHITAIVGESLALTLTHCVCCHITGRKENSLC